MQNRPIRVVLIEIDTSESDLLIQNDESKIRLYKIMDIIEGIVTEWANCDCFGISNNMIAVVWCPMNIEQDLLSLTENIDLLMNEMAELYKIILNVGIGVAVDSPLKAKESKDSAVDILKYKLLYGSGQVFDVYETIDRHEKMPPNFKTEDIVEKIWLNKPDEAIRILSEHLEKVINEPSKYYVTSIQLFFNKLLIDCLILLEKECGNLDVFFVRQGTNLLSIDFCNQSIIQVKNFFTSLIKDICTEIMKNRKDSSRSAVFRAKQIISQKYNTCLSVESIARELHYSKNYFGQLFKSETGMFVNEYINLIRIQKAKQLLVTNKYFLYEIANLVGFEDQQYFTRVFKKVVGVSPSEYCP
jgi:two-component system response regulator YesN